MRGFLLTGRHVLIAGLVIALIATACNGDDGLDVAETPEATLEETEAGPRTVTVNVDGTTADANLAVDGYFPRDLTVRQGDTVEFAFQPGDVHTVTLGTLVDDAFAAFAEMEEDGPPPEEAQKIPFAFSEDGQSLIYGAALACYTEEDPPTDGPPCEETEQPAFEGSLAFYNSGVQEPEQTWSLEVDADAETGTYNFLCLVHGPDMSGSLTIVGEDESAPTPDEVQAAGEADFEATIEAAQPALDVTPEGTHPGLEEILPQGPDHVLAGGFIDADGVPVEILQFGPTDVNITAGESVTWSVVGFHTISFEAPQDATPPIVLSEEGLPAPNPLAFEAQGGAAGLPPPEGQPPPPGDEPPGPPTVINGGEWDGAGFFSSGMLVSLPPSLVAYEVEFATEGTYEYRCLVHQDMEGTVNVTP